MTKPYKLNSEIERFIIDKKQGNQKLSCRSLVSLIKERFNADISKSSINAIIKGKGLSNKIGRPRIKEVKPVEIQIQDPAVEEVTPVQQEEQKQKLVFEAFNPVLSAALPAQPPGPEAGTGSVEKHTLDFGDTGTQTPLIEGGGALFLLMADYKFGLTDLLCQKMAPFMLELSQEKLRLLVQSRVYEQVIKDEAGLWKFLGKELVSGDLHYWRERLDKLPLDQLVPVFSGLGLGQNINDSNDLYKQCLLSLNKQVQNSFLPSVYQLLDLPAMCERFYSLAASIKKVDNTNFVQFLYRPGTFKAFADIIWQDDFQFAIGNINKERVFSPEGRLFRIEQTLSAY